MSSDNDFLSRWSRRKQAAGEKAPKLDAQKPEAQPVAKDALARAENEEKAFDITKLPPVDSITAISDVRDFLRAGVPADLTRAALRRAWSADPAIRDFVGLAENAWDFTDPNAIPGFGPLEATDNVRQMVEQIISRIDDAASASSEKGLQSSAQDAGSAADSRSEASAPADDEDARWTATREPPALSAETADSSGALPRVDIASHHRSDETSQVRHEEQKILRRTHGSAFPH